MKFQHRRSACTTTLLALLCCLPACSQSAGPSAALPEDPGYLQQQTAAAQTGTQTEAPGTIQGTVADAHGGLVPKASVTLGQKGRSDLRETTTDSAGHFAFANVAAGTYTVLISAPELKTFLSPPIVLAAGEHYELPETALPVVASTSINVSANSVEVAEEELNRETKQRVLGIFPNFYTSFVYDAAPLNTRQKFKLSLRSVTDPVAFIGPAITAGIETGRDTFPSWGQDGTSYAKRYAAAYGDELLTRMFSYSIYPAIFHQDPRYFYMGPTNKVSTRFWHAALSGIVTRADNGHLQPNYSHMLGSASAGALSSVYHPASDSAGYLAALNFAIGLASHGGQALIREFVLPHFTTHVPAYAKGKAEQPATANP